VSEAARQEGLMRQPMPSFNVRAAEMIGKWAQFAVLFACCLWISGRWAQTIRKTSKVDPLPGLSLWKG
jgi:hypothetical protein